MPSMFCATVQINKHFSSGSLGLTSYCPTVAKRFYVRQPRNAPCKADALSPRGKHLRISEPRQNKPFVTPELPNKGIDFAILEVMADTMGFTYDTTVDVPYSWKRWPNGSSSGLIYKVNAICQVMRLIFEWLRKKSLAIETNLFGHNIGDGTVHPYSWQFPQNYRTVLSRCGPEKAQLLSIYM